MNTPQRPQQQRRIRRTTMNDGGSCLLHVTHSAQALRAGSSTPPQKHQVQQRQRVVNSAKIHRQHSVSCGTPPGKLSPPHSISSSGSQSSLFAGSKFMDSPAPEQIPMPPLKWFLPNDLTETPKRPASSVSESSAGSSFEQSSGASSGDEVSSNVAGYRVNPMQLIAAISAAV